MAEKKITCPNCFNTTKCFEETAMDFKSYMCFNCGFTSNSSYINDSEALKGARINA
jgi:DNA-directed RNA polymerase subunit RPC12/RpoP